MVARTPDRPSFDLPEVTNQEVDEWLATQEASARRHLARMITQHDAENAGDIPRGSFDPDLFEKGRYTAALLVQIRKILAGVFAEHPLLANVENADDEFLSIMRNLYSGKEAA